MKDRKKLLSLVVLVLFVLVQVPGIFAEGSKESTTKATEIVIAIHTDPGHPTFKIGERLKKNLEEQSQGRMTVTILGTEVGGERDHLEGVSNGEYTIALGGSVPMTLYAPKFAAADIPFVYSNNMEARKVYEGQLGELLNKDLVANGKMRLVGLSVRTARNLTSNFPVKTPADIRNVRMRVPEIAPWVKVWKQIGALPSPIAWPEVYTSLQTGVIEMQENPVDILMAGRMYEVQKYLNRTQHVYSFFHWLINERFYQGMSEADRNLLLSTIKEATAWGDKIVLDGEATLTEQLTKEKGMILVEPDVAAFKKAAEPAVREIAESYHPEVKAYVLSFLK